MKFFKSLTPRTAIHTAHGSIIKFEHYEPALGYAKVEEEPDILALQTCIKKGIGGRIAEVDKDEYESWRKKNEGRAPYRAEREVIREGVIRDTITPKIPPHSKTTTVVEPRAAEDHGGGGGAHKKQIEGGAEEDPGSPVLKKRR